MGRPRKDAHWRSSYEPFAKVPKLGTRWLWEEEAVIEVIEATWNGEEWWVRTRTIIPRRLPLLPGESEPTGLNDLSRFWEACLPIGKEETRRFWHRPGARPGHQKIEKAPASA